MKQEQNELTEKSPVTGIIGAMPEEVASLVAAARVDRRETVAGMEFIIGALGSRPVVIAQCGMGKVNAALCAHTMASLFGATEIINTGVAGSLDNTLDIGDFVISTEALQHDFDVSPVGFRKAEIPYTGLAAFPADPELRARAAAAVRAVAPEQKVMEGRICSGDQFIASTEQKNRIVSEFGGLCCEMEGAAIAQACYLDGVPFVIVRAISDKADDSEEVSFEVFAKAAAERGAAAVKRMLGL